MKNQKKLVLATVLLLSASMFSGCMTLVPTRMAPTTSYENPQWAPPYYSGARYYYLPDLELYYDLSSREYIFLMDGRWNFSPYVPAMYRNYDLNNCFSIVMNVDVYKPWLHHQYYVSHYPRYYYRDYYDRSNIPYVRAYNENLRRAVYWDERERDRARPWNDENLRNNRRFKYSDEDRREQKNQSQQQRSFGGESRGGQQNTSTQTRTTTRTEMNTQPRTNTTQPRTTTTQPRTTTRTESNTLSRPETKTRTQSNQTETRTSSEARPQTETRTRSEATSPSESRTPASTRTTTTTTRQASTSNETPASRNNQTNYYGRTIGNSVRVTKEMKDNKPANRTSRQTDSSR